MSSKIVFVTGVDTDVGKTKYCIMELQKLRKKNRSACGYKVIACGDSDDARKLADASFPPLQAEEANDIFFEFSAAPLAQDYLASLVKLNFNSKSAHMQLDENTANSLILKTIRDRIKSLSHKYEYILVEGAGGWEMPVSKTLRIADIAEAIGAPVTLLASNRLGVLNHVLLSVNAIRARGLQIRSVVLNDYPDRDTSEDYARQTNFVVLRKLLPELDIVMMPHY